MKTLLVIAKFIVLGWILRMYLHDELETSQAIVITGCIAPTLIAGIILPMHMPASRSERLLWVYMMGVILFFYIAAYIAMLSSESTGAITFEQMMIKFGAVELLLTAIIIAWVNRFKKNPKKLQKNGPHHTSPSRGQPHGGGFS